MQKLSTGMKLKLVWPFMYMVLAMVFFTATWPAHTQAHHAIGSAVTILAFIFWIVARIQLGNAFTVTPDAKFIVCTGLYRKLRHPVYYFSILAVAGFCIYAWQWCALAAFVLLVSLQIFRINKEEALLSKRFGEEYLAYKRSTWF